MGSPYGPGTTDQQTVPPGSPYCSYPAVGSTASLGAALNGDEASLGAITGSEYDQFRHGSKSVAGVGDEAYVNEPGTLVFVTRGVPYFVETGALACSLASGTACKDAQLKAERMLAQDIIAHAR